MYRIRVGGGNIVEVGYTDRTLEIKFANDTVYQYYNVPAEVVERFLQSYSKQEYFEDRIKGIYDYQRTF